MMLDSNQPETVMVADARASDRTDAPRQAVDPVVGLPAGAGVYLEAARNLLPRWVHVLGDAAWLHQASCSARPVRVSGQALQQRQSAALGVAMITALDPGRGDEAYLRECVRTALIRWRLLLRTDGRPIHRALRRSPLTATICATVVQLLTETEGFQTTGLLQDVGRHLRWLARRPLATPYLEATAICAMADGAPLCRDVSLLRQARKRLANLLRRQSPEGWFPERGGADIGRLSLTIDALGRLDQLTGWDELEGPLKKALHFLLYFARPDGGIGGCYGSCETAFVSPYGPELLAPTFPDAAKLALVCRRRFERLAAQPPSGWHEELCGAIGANVALAAANAPSMLNASDTFPFMELGQTHFPLAGLSVFNTKAYRAVVGGRKGGSLHVTFKAGNLPLDDPGVFVVFPHKVRTSGRHDMRTRYEITGHSVSSSGILQSTDPSSEKWARLLGRTVRRCTAFLELTFLSAERRQARRMDSTHLIHDRYRREITFGADWIRIRDVIRCRRPCQTIVCQAPLGQTSALVDCANAGARAPIYIDGGRRVAVTRFYRNGRLHDQRGDPLSGSPVAHPQSRAT